MLNLILEPFLFDSLFSLVLQILLNRPLFLNHFFLDLVRNDPSELLYFLESIQELDCLLLLKLSKLLINLLLDSLLLLFLLLSVCFLLLNSLIPLLVDLPHELYPCFFLLFPNLLFFLPLSFDLLVNQLLNLSLFLVLLIVILDFMYEKVFDLFLVFLFLFFFYLDENLLPFERVLELLSVLLFLNFNCLLLF